MSNAIGERIRREMLCAAWSYGKLGLLIDDQVDAVSWVAREIYAADALPAWWNVVRSMCCAAHAVRTFGEIVKERTDGSLRGLCIVDRYLPTVCGSNQLPRAWDLAPSTARVEREVEIREQLGKAFADLLPETSTFRVVPVTSYPYVPSESAPAFKWRTRTIEQLTQLRKELEEDEKWSCLLSYGPEEDAPVCSSNPLPPELVGWEAHAEAIWRARTWRPLLRSASRTLQAREKKGQRAVVLTGAGASLAQGPHGAGMPATLELLRRACGQSNRGEPAGGQDPWPPRRELSCLCGNASTAPRDISAVVAKDSGPTQQSTGAPPNRMSPIQLLKRSIASGGNVEWRLELLDPDLHNRSPVERKEFTAFHRAFRDALYECDHGYPYHLWLLARMGWDAIVTTNFDAFHERAAADAARLPWIPDDARRSYLRLAEDAAGERSEGSLHKPYGSLYRTAPEIALSKKAIEACKKRFKEALEKAFAGCRSGVLMVVGHSLRDRYISDALESGKKDLKKIQLMWLDPASFRQVFPQLPTVEPVSSWVRMLQDRCGNDAPAAATRLEDDKAALPSGPVPATALEFLYDLWRTVQGRM